MKFLLFFLLVPSLILGQRQEQKVLLYNIGFGGLTSAVGAVINKPKDANWKHYFVKGFWQGSIGGALNYSGKKTIYLVNKKESLIYAWPAKLLHSAGVSIIENASLNQPFLRNWNMDFGPVRFDFSLNDDKGLRVRFLPFSIYSVVAAFSNGDFDFSTTMQTGSIAFKRKGAVTYSFEDGLGASYGRAFDYTDSSIKYHIVAHELIHQFQFNDYQVFNTYLKPLEAKVKWEGIKTTFRKYVFGDIPYFLAIYGLEGMYTLPKYYRNFYEFEAERFATNSYVHFE